jgi:DNA-binding MarR family transcriptional regulator
MHIHILLMNERIDLPCLCANVRRASRVLSQIYDDAMRPLGLRMTQFSILQALSLTGPRLQGELAEFLALDSTSFTRAAQQLRRRGWVKTVKGKDRRERLVSLSQSGEAELARAKPARGDGSGKCGRTARRGTPAQAHSTFDCCCQPAGHAGAKEK